MISANDLSPSELAALLAFHSEAGVEWLIEEEPLDRLAEFEAMRMRRTESRAAPQANEMAAERRQPVPETTARERAQAAPTARPPVVAIPDEQAIKEAQFVAGAARSLGELRTAMEAFSGCNLRNSARKLVFAEGSAASGVMIIGPMPYADDDRDGHPFAGRHGQMLERMLFGIGLSRDDVLLTNTVPWRPPGNRVPSAREADICRPFIERQIELAEPKQLLLLGNFTARFFFGGAEMIHQLRGEWRELTFAGTSIPALATLHPQDLIAAPINKRFAWLDLLAFKSRPEL
ncbi:uracil-DNA glycosylase [Sinorhizobium medicae]|uniref:uracil-DNA glycosylase n=1 Tax=Sinorhizobium medicae TaxID=110321 RepID=UPI002AF6BDC2|nr:uracil-DNA glycosylase [Sinorhizobium medicae]WQO86836.1 uracil-DNA glycosylase [Sinorhizobium medicae]